MTAQLFAHFYLPRTLQSQLLHHFSTLGSSTRTSFYPLWTTTPLHSLLHHFTLLAAQLLAHFNLPLNTSAPTPTPLSPLGSSNRTSFYPLWTTTPLNSLLHHFASLAAQLLAHFTPYDRITPNSYTNLPLGSSNLTSTYPLWTNYPPSLLHHFTPLAAQLLAHFNLPLTTSPPTLTPLFTPWQLNSYLISHLWTNYPLPPPPLLHLFTPLATQLLHQFTPLTTKFTPTLTQLYRRWQLNSYLNFSPLNKLLPPTLIPFYPHGSSTLTSFYPLGTSYRLTLTSFYPFGSPALCSFLPPQNTSVPTLTPLFYPWQLNSYLILHLWTNYPPPPPLLHHFTILAAQLLHHFTPSQQITPNSYTTYPRWQLNSCLIICPVNKLPPHSYTVLPPWELNSYIILPPYKKITPWTNHHYSYTILPPLAAQLLHHFTPSQQITPTLTQLYPLGSSTLTSFYPLTTK